MYYLSPLPTHTSNPVPSHWSSSWAFMMISQGKSIYLSLSCSVFVSHFLFLPPLPPHNPHQILKHINWSAKVTPHQPWPITVLSGMEYSDGPRACPSLCEVEHILMDNPTDYVCNLGEGSSPQKEVFYHTQIRNRLHLKY